VPYEVPMILSLASFIRLLIGWVDLAFLSAIMYVLSFLPSKYLGRWYRRCFRYWCAVFARALRVQLFLHQNNLQPLPEHFIIIANHPSVFEDLGMSALFNAHFLAKIEVKDWWIVGRIGKAAGTLYVNRDCKESRAQATNTMLEALNKGLNIGLYPEGGCKGRRIFTPFRYGAFDLALQSGIPIIPVFLHYEAQQDFEWQNQHLLCKLWVITKAQNHRANYYVYDAIDPKQFSSKEALTDHVQNLYLQWQKRYLL